MHQDQPAHQRVDGFREFDVGQHMVLEADVPHRGRDGIGACGLQYFRIHVHAHNTPLRADNSRGGERHSARAAADVEDAHSLPQAGGPQEVFGEPSVQRVLDIKSGRFRGGSSHRVRAAARL